jgi:hypothetical protein
MKKHNFKDVVNYWVDSPNFTDWKDKWEVNNTIKEWKKRLLVLQHNLKIAKKISSKLK